MLFRLDLGLNACKGLTSFYLVFYSINFSCHHLLLLSTVGFDNMDQSSTVSCFSRKFIGFSFYIILFSDICFFIFG